MKTFYYGGKNECNLESLRKGEKSIQPIPLFCINDAVCIGIEVSFNFTLKAFSALIVIKQSYIYIFFLYVFS